FSPPVILHLFVLHDFDKSGFLDGLELLRLLRRILAKHLQRDPAEESVVFLVDDILGTRDLNQDGLLSAQELVTPPVSKAEDSPPVNVALPIPPGARTGASPSEDDPQSQTDTSEDEPAPPSGTAQEEPAATNHEAASVQRANESEEAEEDDGEIQVAQEEM
ncbi:PREDICTED: cell growth regulator with EF hand domain protein 1, partial [Nanorana parkeri]|uniref:cell growth regulator with EF hand domain protein 1 n=1 Tax=Nanorana parkeri TaxID=125878 RepID=UPI0008544A0E